MKFIVLAILLLVLIAFIVLVVKASRNWRWYHITSAVIAMLLAIILLFPTAASLKSRSEWHKLKEQLETRLTSVEEENDRLRYGDPQDPTASPGLEPVALQLSNLGTEAGRRWRNLSLVSADATGDITLRAPQPEVAPGLAVDPAAGANPTGPLVPANLVVYGFAENQFPGTDRPVPTFYLGEFRVTGSQPTSVTVTPTAPLTPLQARAINSRSASSWSLYEMLPLDGHAPFIAEGSKEDDDNALGRVDDKLINVILKDAAASTRTKYLRDGQRGAPEDPAARWVKIKFEKPYTLDVDSPEQRGALEGGFFDNNGRAVDSRLQRSDGGSVTFAVDETLIVKEEAARQLINQEKVASLVDTYYLRPLNDYRYVLRKIRLQIKEYDVRIAEMQYEKQVLEAAFAATVDMISKRQEEKLKLEQDFAQYKVETKAVTGYFNQVREELRQVKEASSLLYRSNFQLLRQIEQLSNAAAVELTET
ncbi:MAG: hypothetical protein AAF802_26025 [Planctomycetota bacterium]